MAIAVFVDRRTLPILESPYPMLVLVGPQGVGKKTLAQKLAEDLPDYFGYALVFRSFDWLRLSNCVNNLFRCGLNPLLIDTR